MSLYRALIAFCAASSMIHVSSFVRRLTPSTIRQGSRTTFRLLGEGHHDDRLVVTGGVRTRVRYLCPAVIGRGGDLRRIHGLMGTADDSFDASNNNRVTAAARNASTRPSPQAATQLRAEAASGGTTSRQTQIDRSAFVSNTGGLRRLPVVKAPTELANRARRVALAVKADVKTQNAKARAKKHGAESINALVQELCVPLRDVVRGYKREWSRLHPFERVVADLTARSRERRDGVTLQSQLDDIHEARKMVLDLGKDWIAKVKGSETAREAGECLKEAIDALLRCFDEFAVPPVQSVLEMQRALRSAPIVQLDTPAVVAVGAPNVGKSSIIRAVSSATPEVNNYPFTTRGMTLGHVEVFWASDSPLDIAGAVVPREEGRRTGPTSASRSGKNAGGNDVLEDEQVGRYAFSQLCQVMDSPGLLSRPDDERNEMEALTLAAMQHLPTAVMYVMDLSGAAGDKCSSVEDQLALRREMRSRFPRRPWIDVVSKVDLGIVPGAEEELREILDGAPFIKLSIHEGTGVQELRMQILRMLGEVRLVLDAMSATERQVQP